MFNRCLNAGRPHLEATANASEELQSETLSTELKNTHNSTWSVTASLNLSDEHSGRSRSARKLLIADHYITTQSPLDVDGNYSRCGTGIFNVYSKLNYFLPTTLPSFAVQLFIFKFTVVYFQGMPCFIASF